MYRGTSENVPQVAETGSEEHKKTARTSQHTGSSSRILPKLIQPQKISSKQANTRTAMFLHTASIQTMVQLYKLHKSS